MDAPPNIILDKSKFEFINYFDGQVDISCSDVNFAARILHYKFKSKIDGVQQGICILMERSAHYIASVFAAWRAGFYVVPLNTSWPKSKNLEIINLIKPAMVLVDDDNPLDIEFDLIRKSDLFDQNHNPEVFSTTTSFNSLLPSDVAYVIFTSGSTGEPKGVVIPASAFNSYIDWTKRYFCRYSKSECLLLTSELTFDITMGDVAFALAFGTSIGVAKHNTNIPSILGLIMRYKIDVLYSVPTTHLALLRFAKQKKGADISSLQLILSGGDRFPWQMVKDYKELSNAAHFYNVYGPTEVTINCFATRLDNRLDLEASGKPVPIGKCFDSLDYILLDDDGSPAEEGELCVTGSQMMLGYHNDLQRTQDAFTKDPRLKYAPRMLYRTGDVCYQEDDLMYIKGRIDGLIKVRGYRIHPDEISKQIDSVKGVDMSAVVPYGNQSDAALAAFVRKEKYVDLNKETLLKKLSNELPLYMIPSHLEFLEEFPLNQSGKIDKIKLSEYLNEPN